MILKSKSIKVNFLGAEEMQISELEKKNCRFYEILPLEEQEESVSHHILLVDVSGSMYNEIPILKAKVKDLLKALKTGGNHYVSILIYSGHYECYRIVSAVKCDTVSYKMARVYEVLEEELYTRSITVMSEPLETAIEIVQSLAGVCEQHHIALFTDGCLVPSKWSVKEEEKKCFEVAKLCWEKGIYFNAIGFGAYYDREFLKKMIALSKTGQLMHIDEIKDYYKAMLQLARQVDDQYSVDLTCGGDLFVCDAHIRYKQGTKLQSIQKVKPTIVVTFDAPLKIENKVVKDEEKVLEEGLRQSFFYELALYHILNEDLDNAELALAQTEDLYAYQTLANGYSFRERGKAIELLNEMIKVPEKRYRAGRVPIKIYLPEEEPLCLLEVLEAILRDSESRLLWDYHYAYKRIGIKTHVVEDNYHFIRPEAGYGEVVGMSIGSKKLNIGVKVKIEGLVEEKETGLKIGADLYRDYNLVVNGNINTTELWCELSKSLVTKFRKEKLIKRTITMHHRKIYTLNLTKLKATNKRMLKVLDQRELARYLYDIEVLECKQWAIKKVREQLLKEVEKKAINLEAVKEDIKMLKKRFRIDEKGIYKPCKVEKCDAAPYEVYPATVLEWKVDKFPKKKEQEKALKYYEGFIGQQVEESYRNLTEALELVRKEKREKEDLVNLVRLSYGLTGKALFIWEEETEKSKTETDKVLGINAVVGGKARIRTKTIDEIRIREDAYTVLTRCN